MDIICIDNTFKPEILQFYKDHNVTIPEKGVMYSVRELIQHSMADIGFKLNEIYNPEVPINHPILGIILVEPTWHIRRFTNLHGNTITKEQIEELKLALKEVLIDTVECA